jgi:hypothetical protein
MCLRYVWLICMSSKSYSRFTIPVIFEQPTRDQLKFELWHMQRFTSDRAVVL